MIKAKHIFLVLVVLVVALIMGFRVSSEVTAEPTLVVTEGKCAVEPIDTFKVYNMPEEYKQTGGYFPEEVQRYLSDLCDDRGLDYPTLIALVERESGYQCNVVGDNGNSYGYGQIYKIWHKQRMAEEGVEDLTDPYGNLRVCTSYLQYINNKYGDKGTHYVLMVYNMGEPVAYKAWNNGVYSTEYSRTILNRAEEIRQELQDL